MFQSEETLNRDISDNSSMTGRQYIPFNLKHAFSVVIVLYITALDAVDIGVVSKKFCRIKMTCQRREMRLFRPAVCLKKLSVFRKFIKLKQWKTATKVSIKHKKNCSKSEKEVYK